jgi:hypothetical protein
MFTLTLYTLLRYHLTCYLKHVAIICPRHHLCFLLLANCPSRKSLGMTIIRMPRGWRWPRPSSTACPALLREFSALCFQRLPTCFSRKPCTFTFIRKTPGGWPIAACLLFLSFLVCCHPEPGRLFLANGGEGSAFGLNMSHRYCVCTLASRVAEPLYRGCFQSGTADG